MSFVSYDNRMLWRMREVALTSGNAGPEMTAQSEEDRSLAAPRRAPTREVSAVALDVLCNAHASIASQGIWIPTILDHLADTLAGSVFSRSGTNADMLLNISNRLAASKLAQKRSLVQGRAGRRDQFSCCLCLRVCHNTMANSIPDTYKISDIFTNRRGPYEYDVDDIGLMEEQMKSLRYVFEQNRALLEKVFSHYAAAGGENTKSLPTKGRGQGKNKRKEAENRSGSNKNSIDRSEMNAFIKDIKILHRHKKRLKNSHVISAFNKSNQDEQARVRRESAAINPDLSDEDDDNPDDELTSTEFGEVMIRLALKIYGHKTLKGEYDEPWPLSKMIEKFFAEDVRPHACAPNKNALESALKNPVAVDAFYENRKILKRIFDKYAAADQSDAAAKATGSINLEELKVMVRDAKLMGPILSDRMLRQLFIGAQGSESSDGDDIEIADDDEMDYGEFLEIITSIVSAIHCNKVALSSSDLLFC
eukprot:g219.t1